MTETQNPQNKKDGLALIVGGLFVLGLVFATYSYFNQGNIADNSQNPTAVDKLKEIISSSTKRDETGNTVDTKDETTKTTEEPKVGDKTSENTTGLGVGGEIAKDSGATITFGGNTTPTSTTYTGWTLNDYKKGDITGGSYTVKSGDTLWEIAEGVYGNGYDWKKILEANKSNIGYLPNGQQALIMPGQVLVLP